MNVYYIINASGAQEGPFPVNELMNHGLTPETMVWCAGFQNWLKAKDVAELQFLFVGTPPVNEFQNAVPPIPGQQPNVNPNYNGMNQNANYGNQNVNNTGMPSGQCPQNYMVFAILTTLFCCLPAGVVAIVYSSRVSKYWNCGNIEYAQAASNNARNWCIISAIAGAVWGIISFCLGFAEALLEAL